MMAEQEKPATKEPGVPTWATQPWEEFIQQTERLGQLLHLSMRGISVLQTIPKLAEAPAKVKDDFSEESQQEIENAQKEAELARREIKEGFPLLHAQATVALWSALEATVRLFMVRWLQNYKQAMAVEAIQKLRVRIGEYERLEGDDRFFFILERLEQELSASLKNGVARFESLLDSLGLSGLVDQDIRRNLSELNQVRNTLVHRSGIADRRLVETCPWLQLKVGEPVKLDEEATRRYFESVLRYSTELVARIGEHFGVDMSKFRSQSSAPQAEPDRSS